jgi:hypothetical protein
MAATANWSEVVRFTGAGGPVRNTTAFAVGHAAWRIQWNYTYAAGFEDVAGLVVFTYPQGESQSYIDMILALGSSQATGTEYIYNHTGTFYMTIAAPLDAVTSYTIIVEQDLNSVPEFSISSVTLLFCFGATSAAVIAGRRKLR